MFLFVLLMFLNVVTKTVTTFLTSIFQSTFFLYKPCNIATNRLNKNYLSFGIFGLKMRNLAQEN